MSGRPVRGAPEAAAGSAIHPWAGESLERRKCTRHMCQQWLTVPGPWQTSVELVDVSSALWAAHKAMGGGVGGWGEVATLQRVQLWPGQPFPTGEGNGLKTSRIHILCVLSSLF